MTSNSSTATRKSSSLPAETVEYLKAWMSPQHIAHPYPTEQEKEQIMAETGIELKQLTNWFVNNRKRYWKPRVEAKIQQHALATVSVSPEEEENSRTLNFSSGMMNLLSLYKHAAIVIHLFHSPPFLFHWN